MPWFKGVINALRRVKYRGIQPKFCPMCKGHNIYPRSNYGVLPETYKCRDCGYEGALVLEITPEGQAGVEYFDEKEKEVERDLNKL